MEKNKRKLVLKSFDRIVDYSVYADWWVQEDLEPPQLKSLPMNGYSVFDDERLIACGFLAITDCDFGVFCFWYCNPDNRAKQSYIGLKMITEAAKMTCLYSGRNQVFAYTSHRGMVKLLEGCDFFNVEGHLRWSHD